MSKESKRSISAVIAFIIAIIALLLSAVPIINNFAFVLAILALIVGIVGYKKTSKGKLQGRKMSIISIVLALLAGAIVLASQAFYSDTIDTATQEVEQSLDSATGENTDELLANDVDVEIGKFKIAEDDFITETSLPVKITNKNSEVKSYDIKIEAVDASGKRITEDTVYVDSLGSNQSQELKAFEFVDTDKIPELKKAEFKVISVSQY
jgi:hypothetical protein